MMLIMHGRQCCASSTKHAADDSAVWCRLVSSYMLCSADAITVFARALLQTPDWFVQFCQACSAQMAQLPPVRQAGGQVLLAFLDKWLDRFDSIGTPAARKLSALALCNVLPMPVPSVLERLDGIAAHLTAVYFEVRNTEELHIGFASVCSCCSQTASYAKGCAIDDLSALQLEGSDGTVSHLGTEYYTTLRTEVDQDLSAATVASEEAQGDISR